MRLRKSTRKLPAQPEVQRYFDVVDRVATDEGNALQRAPHSAATHITSSIPWAPSKPSGSKGWLRMSESRKMRGQFVRGNSNRTPKLQASYMRAFGIPDTVQPTV